MKLLKQWLHRVTWVLPGSSQDLVVWMSLFPGQDRYLELRGQNTHGCCLLLVAILGGVFNAFVLGGLSCVPACSVFGKEGVCLTVLDASAQISAGVCGRLLVWQLVGAVDRWHGHAAHIVEQSNCRTACHQTSWGPSGLKFTVV